MYTKVNFEKKWRSKIDQLVRGGKYVMGPGGGLTPRFTSGAFETPWIFTNPASRHKFCGYWNAVYHGIFNIIPSHCRFACWKTVIKPRNVKELFELLETMEALGLPGKCGADRRNYTYGAWAGFIYADSLPMGRRYHKMARDVVPDEIPVILKRGCTEMEQSVPSTKWDDLNHMNDAEIYLNDLFHFDEGSQYPQAPWFKNELKARWIERAIEIGDPTAREMAEKHSADPDIWQKIVVNSITYHEEKDNAPEITGRQEIQPEIGHRAQRPAASPHEGEPDEGWPDIRQPIQAV